VSTLIPFALACPPGTTKPPGSLSQRVSVILRVGDLRREKPGIARRVSELLGHVSSQNLSIANSS
jgi:hypothetical protein